MKKGFTLIEMLLVIGIIVVLAGAGLAGFSKMTKSAEKAKCQELVHNAATALSVYFQNEGNWPQALAKNGNGGKLDATAAYPLAKKGLFSLTVENGKLAGLDKFGIVTPWAAAAIKRKGSSAALGDHVTATTTIEDHIFHYAVDLDGDGVIRGVDVGGESVDVRATAIVWCIGKSGGNQGKPWPYSKGIRKDDVYSWTKGQTQDVK